MGAWSFKLQGDFYFVRLMAYYAFLILYLARVIFCFASVIFNFSRVIFLPCMGDPCSWIRIQEPAENKEFRNNRVWKIFKYDKFLSAQQRCKQSYNVQHLKIFSHFQLNILAQTEVKILYEYG